MLAESGVIKPGFKSSLGPHLDLGLGWREEGRLGSTLEDCRELWGFRRAAIQSPRDLCAPHKSIPSACADRPPRRARGLQGPAAPGALAGGGHAQVTEPAGADGAGSGAAAGVPPHTVRTAAKGHPETRPAALPRPQTQGHAVSVERRREREGCFSGTQTPQLRPREPPRPPESRAAG